MKQVLKLQPTDIEVKITRNPNSILKSKFGCLTSHTKASIDYETKKNHLKQELQPQPTDIKLIITGNPNSILKANLDAKHPI